MKIGVKLVRQLYCLFAVFAAVFVANVHANTQQQVINLQQGWNAIYLTVTPNAENLNSLLVDTPIDMIASYFAPVSNVTFIDDPSEQNWKSAQWHKWIAPSRPDAFLTNLSRLNAGRGYLIHSTTDFTWNLPGEVKFIQPQWQANGFTLIGFEVDESNPPSFAQFFSASPSHQDLVAYQLVESKWQLVRQPSQTLIQNNQAYWIYSQGGSDFYGALQISGVATDGLTFAPHNYRIKVTVRNLSEIPADFSFNMISGFESTAIVPLAIETDSVEQAEIISDLTTYQSPLLTQNQLTHINFVLQRNQMLEAESRASLLEIRGLGLKRIIPISAQR
ncbi:hypothetical protein [Catenovulum agarivorans]|uniref:hypothetical protein n=1 Tax=Catenovulum agarivorans TaxID=1172192 RepID=UPI00035E978B|nr:hypothetical protein [Catenovulum agarivorans]